MIKVSQSDSVFIRTTILEDAKVAIQILRDAETVKPPIKE